MTRGSGALRVAHVVQPTHGGVPRVVLTLAEGGRRLGHEVVVLSPDEAPLVDELRAAGLTWRPLGMTRHPSLADLRATLAMRSVLRGFDIVHLHSSKAAAVGRLARLLVSGSAPVVVVPHAWSWFVGGRSARLYRAFERRCRRLADVFVAVSEGEREAGRAVLGDDAPIVVIHNGVDVDRFRPSVAPEHDGTVVVVVGRLCEQKGQDRALEALALLADDVELVLVGDGPTRPELEALARELGVDARTTFAGDTDPRPHLRSADVVLVPSRWEGLSLSMLEAMACGRPVVATAVSGSEVVDGVGVVVPTAASPPELAAAVTGLRDDPARRRALGAAARDRAVERFGTDRMLEHYAALWRDLVP